MSRKVDLKNLQYYERRLLQKCLTMFKWDGLPESIPDWYLNLVLFTEGSIGFVTHNNKYYVLSGNDGGTNIDAYGRANAFIGANPEFSINCPLIWDKTQEVPDGDRAVVCWNDTMRYGLLDLIRNYANQLTECDKSLKIALKNCRDTKMIRTSTDNARVQAQVALEKMYEGQPYAFYDEGSCVGFGDSTSLFDNSSKNNHLQDLVNTRADIISRFCIEIGIPLVNNTKRSQLISGEVGGVKTLGLINVDDMLQRRLEFCEMLNYVFGLNVTVSLNDNWKIEVEDVEQDDASSLIKETPSDNPAHASEQDEEQSDEQSDEQDDEQSDEQEVKKDEY